MNIRQRIVRCMEKASSLERYPDRKERKTFCRNKAKKQAHHAAKRKKRKKRG